VPLEAGDFERQCRVAKEADGMPLLSMPEPFKAMREAACNAIGRMLDLRWEILVVFLF